MQQVDVERQARFFAQDPPRVLVGGEDVVGREPQHLRELRREAPRVLVVARGPRAVVLGAFPERLAVLAPEARESPAREGLARVPLALAVVEEPAGREACAQALQEACRELEL